LRTDIRLTEEDIAVKQQNALDLYYSGIKSSETKRTMTLNLKQFLLDACHDLFKGDLGERAQQFVDLARQDQEKVTHIILGYANLLRNKTLLQKERRQRQSAESNRYLSASFFITSNEDSSVFPKFLFVLVALGFAS
jgi:hypothetical protein